MKILALHLDSISFKPLKRAIKNAVKAEKKETKVKDCLAIFTCIEKPDETNPKAAVEQLTKNIKDIAKQLQTKNIVLYPYAHLSQNLASPESATQILKQTEQSLKKQFKITSAPFGWYKSFSIKCKGHPLSELSREIVLGEKKDQKDGSNKINDIKYDPKQLLREISKSKLQREKLKDNDHRILGQKMDLFSFNETAPGMAFWHNNGLTIKNLLIDFWRQEHKKENYQEISTPQILDKKLWQISGHWEKFKENLFLTKQKQDF